MKYDWEAEISGTGSRSTLRLTISSFNKKPSCRYDSQYNGKHTMHSVQTADNDDRRQMQHCSISGTVLSVVG